MRKIPVKTWMASDGTNEVEDNLINVLMACLNSIPSDKLPRGYDAFRKFQHITDAMEKAGDTLVLEEADYEFLEQIVEAYLPASFGTNKNIVDAISIFMGAEKEEE